MKDFLIGFSLLFLLPSMIQFWFWFLYLEKTHQINLPDDDKDGIYLFCKKRRNK